MKIRQFHLRGLLAALAFAGMNLNANGQTATWNNTGTGAWEDVANWTWTGTVPDPALPDVATSVILSNNGKISLKNSTQSVLNFTINNGRLEVVKDTTDGILGVSGLFYIGSSASTTGSVLIDGLGSVVNKTGSSQTHIGSYGHGTLTLSNQGKMTAVGTIHLGTYTGGAGVLNVNTQGQFVSTSTFIMGYRGSGTMNIETAGYVKTGSSFIAGYGQDANRIQGTASVKVNGAGSRWDLSALYVGHTGTGSMVVENEGMVANASTAYIGYFNAGVSSGSTAPPAPTKYGTGVVTVQTSGVWQSTGAVNIGTNGGTGTLNVTTAGRVNVNGGAGTITLGALGALNVGGDPLLDDPAAPGIISAATVTSNGWAALNLFHNDHSGNYYLSKTGIATGGHVALAGSLTLNALSGTTTLIGSNSFTGGTIIGGVSDQSAKLVVKHTDALMAGQITIKENGTLEIDTSLTFAAFNNLVLEGGSAMALQADPVGSAWSQRIELSGTLDFLVEAGEKITLYLSGTSAIENPELYDWGFLHASGGIYVDPSDLFEVVSDVPGFYVFQRDDFLVLGMAAITPEPTRWIFCLGGIGCIGLRRRRW